MVIRFYHQLYTNEHKEQEIPHPVRAGKNQSGHYVNEGLVAAAIQFPMLAVVVGNYEMIFTAP